MIKHHLFIWLPGVLLIGVSMAARAQTNDDLLAVKITEPEWTLNITVLNDDEPVKTDNELSYHWFKAQEVHQTIGGYAGRLLHSHYEKFDAKGNLIEQGQFDEGLKTGTWKTWYESGQLFRVVDWKDGEMHGVFKQYNEDGGLVLVAEYKKGLLHGDYKEYDNGGLVKEEKYRNGALQIEKPKKVKEKPQEAPAEKVEPTQDSE